MCWMLTPNFSVYYLDMEAYWDMTNNKFTYMYILHFVLLQMLHRPRPGPRQRRARLLLPPGPTPSHHCHHCLSPQTSPLQVPLVLLKGDYNTKENLNKTIPTIISTSCLKFIRDFRNQDILINWIVCIVHCSSFKKLLLIFHSMPVLLSLSNIS